jgi:predicted acetyltransferase
MRAPLILRKLELADEAAFAQALASWDHSSGFTWTAPAPGQSFADFVAMLRRHELAQDLPEGFVPYTIFVGVRKGRIVARANVRHELNEFLRRVGGHVGYAVLPEFRRQGLATAMLAGVLPECRRLGLTRILVTCDKDNVGSARTIEKNAGVLENILEHTPGRPRKRRYWITL